MVPVVVLVASGFVLDSDTGGVVAVARELSCDSTATDATGSVAAPSPQDKDAAPMTTTVAKHARFRLRAIA